MTEYRMTEYRMTDKYEDIINLPHWDPQYHTRMPLTNCASQFAPFAALTGHDEAISETARQTEEIRELDAQSADALNEKINFLLNHIKGAPEIEVTYFVNDTKKSGGAYIVYKGLLRSIDEIQKALIFKDGRTVSINMILHITGKIFNDIENRE